MKHQPNFSQKSQVHTSIWGTQGLQNKVGGGDLVFWSEKWPFETIIEKTIWRPTEDSDRARALFCRLAWWHTVCWPKILSLMLTTEDKSSWEVMLSAWVNSQLSSLLTQSKKVKMIWIWNNNLDSRIEIRTLSLF